MKTIIHFKYFLSPGRIEAGGNCSISTNRLEDTCVHASGWDEKGPEFWGGSNLGVGGNCETCRLERAVPGVCRPDVRTNVCGDKGHTSFTLDYY